MSGATRFRTVAVAMPLRPATIPLATIAILLSLAGCGFGPDTIDTTPPAAVELRATAITDTSVTLAWTAPGDDGTSGRAARYDLRRSEIPITPSNFDSALAINLSVPRSAGAQEQTTILGLEPASTWYFALRSADEVPNWSALSNVLEVTLLRSAAFRRAWRVPDDAPTIAAGIDSAAAGDTVIVACGTWRESGLVMKRGLLFTSASGEADCAILDGEGAGPILICADVDTTSRIVGFTFTRGSAAGGGAIHCTDYASPVISNCVFRENTASGGGGAVLCEDHSSPRIRACEFDSNHASWGGAIAAIAYSGPIVSGSRFIGNSAEDGGALASRGYASPTIRLSAFYDNRASARGGAADGAEFASPAFTGVVFAGNSAGVEGGAASGRFHGNPRFTSCTFVENGAPSGGAVMARQETRLTVERSILAFQTEGGAVACRDGGSVTLQCSDLFGNEGGDWIECAATQDTIPGNLTADPLFCDRAARDFALRGNSPCSADSSACGRMGAVPEGCEAGRR